MPRPPRLNYPDLIYHIFSRGNNREMVFMEKCDYERFLHNLERFRERLKYTLYAYCFLPNHFHLLLKVKDVTHSKIMQILMTAYTMYLNKKYKRVGHVFQGRFQSIVVEKENYLLQVNRYIHLNPVKAKLSLTPEKYPWSSYRDYISPENIPHEGIRPRIDTAAILDLLSQSIDQTRRVAFFQEFTHMGISDDFDPIKKQVRGILGTGKFIQKLTKVLKGTRP